MSILSWDEPVEETIAVEVPVQAPIASDEDEDDGGNSTTGLENIQMGAARIEVDDKQIINCRADLNQLVPFKYKWAWTNTLLHVLTIGCLTKLIWLPRCSVAQC